MKSKNRINRLALIIGALSIPLLAFNIFSLFGVKAAVVTLSPENYQSALAGADVTFTYTASTAVEAAGATYSLIVSPALPSALDDCAAPTSVIDTSSGGAGAFGSFTTTGAIFTTTTDTTTTGRSFCVNFPAESNPDSYSMMLSTSTGDYGLSMIHYADNNRVNVSATVGATLSLNIVNLTDTGDTNVCLLGNVSTLTAVNLDVTDDGDGECGYGVAVGSNAANGFDVQIQGSANGLYNGSSTIANVSGAFNTGTEEYGIANVTVPAGVTADAAFTGANGYAIPTTASDFVSAAAPFTYTPGTDATDVTRVVHGLTVASGTEVGSYTQTVTYTAFANF
ncbi:hypothetical protein KC669_00990 [Candidatus Dojkabacteria bacterium]|uniref:Uncharacterized protein n=1 Tax=Candidatus Dojkabacteria bacterium TaxID=2099670 RepID=A0A955LAA5_9BACT|nr:hypothetical protein [Candidatus Dojkabacteria bacterium]